VVAHSYTSFHVTIKQSRNSHRHSVAL